MNKKITIEFTQEEYDAICKFWEMVKNSPIMPTKALNFDDFCKEIIINMTKMPTEMPTNLDDLMGSLGDLGGLDGLKEALGALGGKKKQEPKTEEKKEDIPDDQKYKS